MFIENDAKQIKQKPVLSQKKSSSKPQRQIETVKNTNDYMKAK